MRIARELGLLPETKEGMLAVAGAVLLVIALASLVAFGTYETTSDGGGPSTNAASADGAGAAADPSEASPLETSDEPYENSSNGDTSTTGTPTGTSQNDGSSTTDTSSGPGGGSGGGDAGATDGPEPDPPNLSVSTLMWSPAEPTEGDEVTFEATLENTGGPVPDRFTLRFLLDGEEVSGHVLDPLDADGTVTVTSAAWTSEAGEHTVRAHADAGAVIEESDEDDNDRRDTIQVDSLLPGLPLGDEENLTEDTDLGLG